MCSSSQTDLLAMERLPNRRMTDTDLAIKRIAEVKQQGFGTILVRVQDGKIVHIEKMTSENLKEIEAQMKPTR